LAQEPKQGVHETEQTPLTSKNEDEGLPTFDDPWKRASTSKAGSTVAGGDARLTAETTPAGLSTVCAAETANAERGTSRAESAKRTTVFRIVSPS
jgi:hypothetical protein